MPKADKKKRKINAIEKISVRDINKIRHETRMPPLVEIERDCLRCEKPFISLGFNNRMCVTCSAYGASNRSEYDDITEPDL